MTESDLKDYIREHYSKEGELCEWKEMKNIKNSFCGDESNDIISYVSAIANMEGGELVIGVKDKLLEVVGIDSYNYPVPTTVLRIKERCTNLSSEGLDIEEFITDDTQKKVWVIHIPKHQIKLPVYAHGKAWQRIKDSLVVMTKERLDAILSEVKTEDDWSAKVILNATIDDLDPQAIALAREKYKEQNSQRTKEIDSWDDITFLNKARITSGGRITNAAIILLGRKESEHFLSPAVCRIRWILKDGGDENKDHRIFSIPMITAIEKISSLIRNTTYTYTVSGNVFPESMLRYDVFTLREPLNNAIAHQDYSKAAIIEVVEYEDEKLMFRNWGQFIPSSVEAVVSNDFPDSRYRNPFLVGAMRSLKMVEIEGGGIRKLFVQQKRRFFPMPEYDISGGMVKCEIEGKVLDENFAKILVGNPALSLSDIILLDKVQKHEAITDDAIGWLRKNKFIEGRKPNIYLSASLVKESKNIGLKSSYIKNKGFDDSYLKKLIIEYLSRFGNATRKDIDQLLYEKLPDFLNDKQKYNRITNLLASLRKSGVISVGDGKNWVLVGNPN